MLGRVSDDEREVLMRRARALAYPSLFEGFGLPPVEAMACACPVIASPRGSLAEVVGDAARLIDPLDPTDIANALGELTIDAHRQTWRERGLRRAALFDWRESARQLTQVYQQTARRCA